MSDERARLEELFGEGLTDLADEFRRAIGRVHAVSALLYDRSRRSFAVAPDPLVLLDRPTKVLFVTSFGYSDDKMSYLQTPIIGPHGEIWNPAYSTWAAPSDSKGVEAMFTGINRGQLLENILEELRKPGRLAPTSPKHWSPKPKATQSDAR